MKPQVIPFRTHHMRRVKPDCAAELVAAAYVGEKSGHCWTVCLLGDPIGCCGIAVQGPQAQVWGNFAPLLKTFPVWLFKFAKARLKETAGEEPQLKTYYSLAEAEDAAAQRFLEHLGFRRDNPAASAEISAELHRAMHFYQREVRC